MATFKILECRILKIDVQKYSINFGFGAICSMTHYCGFLNAERLQTGAWNFQINFV